MRLKRSVEIEVRVTPWVRIEEPWPQAPWIGAYRIWMMLDPAFGRMWQCHEWERRDGNRERQADGWITTSSKRFPANAADPAPGDEPPGL